MDIKNEIKGGQIVIFIIPNSEYAARMEEITFAVSETCSRICYVSLNKPYNVLIAKLKKRGIDIDKLFFIDCVTENAGGKPTEGKVLYITSPKAFTELSIMIKKLMDNVKIESTIFDSLSTLLIYEETINVTRFAQSLMTTLRTRGSSGAFTCLKEDVNKDLIKDLSMFADKIIELE